MNHRMNGFSLSSQIQLPHVHYFIRNCKYFQKKFKVVIKCINNCDEQINYIDCQLMKITSIMNKH